MSALGKPTLVVLDAALFGVNLVVTVSWSPRRPFLSVQAFWHPRGVRSRRLYFWSWRVEDGQ